PRSYDWCAAVREIHHPADNANTYTRPFWAVYARPIFSYPLPNALTETSSVGHWYAASRGRWKRGDHPEVKTLPSAWPNGDPRPVGHAGLPPLPGPREAAIPP